MGSIKDPRTTDFCTSMSEEMPGKRISVKLDCPPDVAVSFLAKLYSAAPELHRAIPLIERSEGEPPPRKDEQ